MTSMTTARRTEASFEIQLQPDAGELPGTGRFDFTKTWTGGLTGTSRGLMLSAGDPASGDAGYVALEVFDGEVDGRAGTLVFQQSGVMLDGETQLTYLVVPGAGTGELGGLAGVLTLSQTDGAHQVVLDYDV